jgi:hypothetical protein
MKTKGDSDEWPGRRNLLGDSRNDCSQSRHGFALAIPMACIEADAGD